MHFPLLIELTIGLKSLIGVGRPGLFASMVMVGSRCFEGLATGAVLPAALAAGPSSLPICLQK